MGALNVGGPAAGSAGTTVPVGRRPLGSQGLVVSDQGLGVTPAQVALAWVHARNDDAVPTLGTKRRRTLDENVGALAVRLDVGELARMDCLAARVVGDRSINPEAVGREAPLPAATRR